MNPSSIDACPSHNGPSTEVASQLIEQALGLCGTIRRYRIALVLDPGPDGPIPF